MSIVRFPDTILALIGLFVDNRCRMCYKDLRPMICTRFCCKFCARVYNCLNTFKTNNKLRKNMMRCMRIEAKTYIWTYMHMFEGLRLLQYFGHSTASKILTAVAGVSDCTQRNSIDTNMEKLLHMMRKRGIVPQKEVYNYSYTGSPPPCYRTCCDVCVFKYKSTEHIGLINIQPGNVYIEYAVMYDQPGGCAVAVAINRNNHQVVSILGKEEE